MWEVDARADADTMKAYALPIRRRFPTKAKAQEWITKIVRATSMDPVRHEGTKVRALRDAFLRSCEAVVAEATLDNYARTTGIFLSWCGDHGIAFCDQISRGVFYDYVDHLQRTYSPSTVTTYAAAVRRMFSWADDRELIEYNPASRAVPSSKPPEKHVLTAHDQRRIARDAPLPWRHLWVVMLDAGVRISEAAGIGDTTVLEGDSLRVLGKGNKIRRVPLSGAGVAAYRAAVAAEIVPTSRSVVDYRFGLMREELGVDCTPHTLRHTYATEMANEYRVPLPVLQLWLGHERLETTAGYLHADWRQASDAVSERGERW